MAQVKVYPFKERGSAPPLEVQVYYRPDGSSSKKPIGAKLLTVQTNYK